MQRIIYAVLLSMLSAGADAQAPSVRTGTTEVLVDVVVRDKKSRIVRDLKPEEIQVLEDGVPQTIRHFELFEGHAPGDNTGPASAGLSAATLAPATPAAQAPLMRTLREATIVSVVVGSLNPEGRKSARDAVRDFIKNELGPNIFVGVFAWTYTGMQTLQGYTNDGARISEAMERAVKWTGLRTIDELDLLPDTVESATAPATTAPRPAAEIESIMATHWMTEYLDAYDVSMRELLAIRGLAQAQARLPGRKLVFLFAGGMIVHPDAVEVLNSTISAANRSNARSGYYALPFLHGEEIYPFEMATLQAINATPAPQQLAFHSEVFRFRPGSQRSQLTFACQVPVRSLSVAEDKDWAKVHVSITALIKDAQGQVVDKLSKDLPYTVPRAKAEELRRRVVSFTTPFRLPPGRYSLEAAAVDRGSARAGVRRSVLLVPPAPNGLAVSDLVLVRRVDAVEEPRRAADPLLARGGQVTPEVSGVVDQSLPGDLIFYGVAYPPLPVQKPVRVILQILRDGQPIVRSPESDVPVEANSAAPFLASLPRAKLQPGHYEAVLTLRYGDQSAQSETAFVVEAGESTATQPQ